MKFNPKDNFVKRRTFLILGYLFAILGLIGAVLPVMPTVPFAIIAAFFFSKSSPRLHQKVLNLPHIGQHVRDWDENGVVSTKAKILSTIGVILFLSSSMYFAPKLYLKIILAIIGVSFEVFILTRPSVKRA